MTRPFCTKRRDRRQRFGLLAEDKVQLSVIVKGALNAAINDHGPITHDYVYSATKRIMGEIDSHIMAVNEKIVADDAARNAAADAAWNDLRDVRDVARTWAARWKCSAVASHRTLRDAGPLCNEWVASVSEVHDGLRQCLAESEASVAVLAGTLETIRTDYGKVCGEYELCTKPCSHSSYGAWAVADTTLNTLPAAIKAWLAEQDAVTQRLAEAEGAQTVLAGALTTEVQLWADINYAKGRQVRANHTKRLAELLADLPTAVRQRLERDRRRDEAHKRLIALYWAVDNWADHTDSCEECDDDICEQGLELHGKMMDAYGLASEIVSDEDIECARAALKGEQ